MLVLLSDLHLTDGTSGETINPRAFQKFGNILLDIIGDNPCPNQIEEIELVLLGDIFDVIRSEVWLCKDNQGAKPIRPWSAPDEVNDNDWTLKDYAEEIVTRIMCNPKNSQAARFLEQFREACKKKKINKVNISYLIGNHDWLINRYSSTRLPIACFLGMPDWQSYEDKSFLDHKEFPEYGVIARHGDNHDPLNYSGNRDASSLGDALVIDLLNRFPQEVKNELGKPENKVPPDLVRSIYRELKEIDNVRPLLEIPAWIKGVCRRYPGNIEVKVHETWNVLAQKFFEISYVQDFLCSNPLLGILLRLALKLTSGFSFGWLMRFLAGKWIRGRYQKSGDYKSYAIEELAGKDDRMKYVVYGHTHNAEQSPLDVLTRKGQRQWGLDRLYFNSGTWRKVYEHTAYDWRKCEFIGWHVLTFLIFYKNNEKEPDRNYEEWSASLGYGR